MTETITISVSKNTHERLRKTGISGQSVNFIIENLLDEHEEKEKGGIHK